MTNHEKILEEGSAEEKRLWSNNYQLVQAELLCSVVLLRELKRMRRSYKRWDYLVRRARLFERPFRMLFELEGGITEDGLRLSLCLQHEMHERTGVWVNMRTIVLSVAESLGLFPSMVTFPEWFNPFLRRGLRIDTHKVK